MPFWKKDGPHPLDKIIADQIEYMETYGPSDPEYQTYFENLTKLRKMRDVDTRRFNIRISWDTVLIVAGNLVAVWMVTRYEDEHAMTSRAPWNGLAPKANPNPN